MTPRASDGGRGRVETLDLRVYQTDARGESGQRKTDMEASKIRRNKKYLERNHQAWAIETCGKTTNTSLTELLGGILF